LERVVFGAAVSFHEDADGFADDCRAADTVGPVVLRLLELADSNLERWPARPVTARSSQWTLAGMVGVSRENVNRALAGLAAERLVRLDGSRYVLADELALRERIARDWLIVERRDRRQAWPEGVTPRHSPNTP
jgi:hypothetical protein